jgi:putative addiction module component (TIGR02574 family)
MSKAEILAELPRLGDEDRREIFERLCEIEELASINGSATPEEKLLLDRELEDYRRNPDSGSSWEEVEARIRKKSKA